MEPFWEREYADPELEAFGPPSNEIVELIPNLPRQACVLDLGCGAGRNALPLAEAGFAVTAIDKSRAGIGRLASTARRKGLKVETRVADIASFEVDDIYDLVVAHGVLHLLPPEKCARVIQTMREATAPGGWNIVAVFTDALPQPPDLASIVLKPFSRGELRALYSDWEIQLAESYILEDEHSGGIQHRHAIDKLVARRPS